MVFRSWGRRMDQIDMVSFNPWTIHQNYIAIRIIMYQRCSGWKSSLDSFKKAVLCV